MRFKLLFLSILFLFFGVRPAFAAAPTISNVPSTINTDSEFSISVTMNGLSNNTIYRLRLALAVTGTSNYFGSTFNGSNWYNGTPSPINYTNFLSVTTDGSGAWSGTLQVKVESSDPNFSGISGTYDLKVGRYTASGTSATWSNIFQTNVVIPTPSPSPYPSSSSPSPSSSTISSSSISTFTISSIPSQIDSTETFNVAANLSLSSKPNTIFYLSGAFKKADSTRYFGLTKINSSWIKYESSNYLNQYKITTDDGGNWTGTLEVKPDTSDTNYKGSGDYIFKVGRYTSSGSGPTWSNEATIKIISAESDQGGNLTNDTSPTTTPSYSPSFQPKSYDRLYHSATVAGATASASTSASTSTKVAIKNKKQTTPIFWVGLIFIFAGIGSIGYIYLKKNGKLPF